MFGWFKKKEPKITVETISDNGYTRVKKIVFYGKDSLRECRAEARANYSEGFRVIEVETERLQFELSKLRGDPHIIVEISLAVGPYQLDSNMFITRQSRK